MRPRPTHHRFWGQGVRVDVFLKLPRRLCHAFEAEVSCSQEEHPRMKGEGRFARCQAAPRKASSAQAVPEGGAERARARVSYFSSMELLRVGLLGPGAQSSLCPRRCPDTALLTQPSPNSAHNWGQHLDPPHSDRDPTRQEQTGLSGCTPAGDELFPRTICHEHGVAFHVPEVGWPCPGPGCLAPGPSFQLCKDRNFILSPPQQEASTPHHLCSNPSGSPHPHPGARASLFHGSARQGLGKGDSEVKFPRSS